MARLRPIGPDRQLTVVDHLDELRSRLIVSLAAFGVALALCFWQNHLLLRIVDAPLRGKRPVTLGVAEPFTATLTVAVYAAVALTLPILLYQLYAYVVPALSPGERRFAPALLLVVPALFVAGVAFGYFVVLPAALRFLLHFNQHEFNSQIRATDWYGFFGISMLACGFVFQVPLGVVAATRLGITSTAALRRNRRYAVGACALVAAALPGVDPISMVIEMVPLVALYELGILAAAALDRVPAPAVQPR